MSDYDIKRYFQDRQQRFEAALKFTELSLEAEAGFPNCIDLGIKRADELLAKLEETEE